MYDRPTSYARISANRHHLALASMKPDERRVALDAEWQCLKHELEPIEKRAEARRLAASAEAVARLTEAIRKVVLGALMSTASGRFAAALAAKHGESH